MPPATTNAPTLTDLRNAFAADGAGIVTTPADEISRRVNGDLVRRRPTREWTNRAVWYESDTELMAIVGAQEAESAEIALSHGLLHCGQRRLILVLAKPFATPTICRRPWLTADIDIWTYHDHNHAELSSYDKRQEIEHAAPLTQAQTISVLKGPATETALHLNEQSSEWVRELCEWAARQRNLDAAHLKNMRAWSCLGMRVLSIKGQRRPVISAGINAKGSPAFQLPHPLTGPLSADDLSDIKAAVQDGIDNATGQTYGAFAEHRLQQLLRADPSRLALEHPVLREVPAWRFRGRGFIDLVGLDSLGDLVLVETKLAADDMLVLQGLDYWIWAHKTVNRRWLIERLHASPDLAKTRLLYAVGEKDGTKPKLSRYCRAHLDALHPDVDWRLALLTAWTNTDTMEVDLLARRAQPA